VVPLQPPPFAAQSVAAQAAAEQSAFENKSFAVLELFKQGFIELDQPAAFGDIEIIWIGSPALSVADLSDIDTYEG
jgi:chromatin segregation and condensation protein Rec8/ScpA/Scc1 (kleisin family)